jgi:hypothetical protein
MEDREGLEPFWLQYKRKFTKMLPPPRMLETEAQLFSNKLNLLRCKNQCKIVLGKIFTNLQEKYVLLIFSSKEQGVTFCLKMKRNAQKYKMIWLFEGILITKQLAFHYH